MGGEIDNRNAAECLDAFGGLDPVQGSSQADIHEDEVGPQRFRRFNGIFTVRCDGDGTIARSFELAG
jgi:hypothetical protein